VLQDGSSSDTRDVVSPAVLGARLAFDGSGFAFDVVDVGGDASEALDGLAAVIADPDVAGIVIAPYTMLPADGWTSLATARVPVVVLSEAAPRTPRSDAWRSLVPRISAEAAALVSAGDGRPICMTGDGSAWSRLLTSEVRRAVHRLSPAGPEPMVRAVDPGSPPTDCGIVLWTGSAAGAVALQTAPSDVALAVGSRARTASLLERTGPVAGLVSGVCGCVDVGTSSDPHVQGFVHDFQASTGLDPGPYAVEGYDAGSMLRRALEGEPSPVQARTSLSTRTSYKGVASRYVWDPQGDLEAPTVRTYAARGWRWLESTSG
jgi:hypothetical protein